ncbi:hypothetical protein BH753_gp055 [Bacillus phage Shbh1]|uniref:Spo0E like sporulation regulatory protein n=1 Tax=Bacillus phage Shbh1 TaxID=1796992 RepID=A0A142F180_9CAUD|nr:hypothetical protein BH753_gp055 [Bacillus phage Shbh1]AMQ66537.1 hypothetical protein [Bacillus phage Shbh1]
MKEQKLGYEKSVRIQDILEELEARRTKLIYALEGNLGDPDMLRGALIQLDNLINYYEELSEDKNMGNIKNKDSYE